MTEDFEARYHDLAVVTCEWRAFGMDDPEAMAARVFARLRALQTPPDLRRFYRCVDDVVDEAYRDAAGQQPLINVIMGGESALLKRAPKTPAELIRKTLVALPMREVDLLRQAYWDDLTPDEMAVVGGRDAATQRDRLAAAVAHFTTRLPAGLTDDPVAALRSIKPGEHHRGAPDGIQ